MNPERFVGRPIKRKEDPRMMRGLATYVADVRRPGMHQVAILRSPHAHARLRSIDVEKARRAAGVVCVVTGEETKALGGVPRATVIPPDPKSPRRPVLAEGKVRFVGEGIAAVVAETEAQARDALDLIEVDYEPLPVASDPEEAAKPGAPLVHEELGSNVAFDWKLEGGPLPRAEAFRKADRVIRQRIEHPRLIPVAMEPRGVVAEFHRGLGELTLWTSTQIPHLVRTFVALQLKLPENKLRVIAPDVGGGFGSKLNVYAEEILLGHLAMRTGLPVRWIERRSENFLATIHGRGQAGELSIAVKNDGTVLGLHYKVTGDLGAYHQLLTPAMPAITGLMLSGAYAIPSLCMEARGVFTNRMSTDAYRGAGRPEATFVVERMVDLVASELGLDPVEVRRRNFPKEFPYTTATGLTYDSGDYVKTLDRALELIDYRKLRAEQAKRRKEGGKPLGIGISSYVEICALGPSGAMPCGGFGWESCTVRIEPTGTVTVLSGASPHGQGQETSFAQIAADALGVDLEAVNVVHGDTAAVPYGVGTFGSRATAVGGTALLLAIEKLTAKATRIAAHLLETEPKRVTFEGGRFSAGGKSLSLGEVAFAAHGASKLPPGEEPGLEATHFFEPKNFTFPFGTHVCVVEVDPETGDVQILRYVAVDDCGRVINPLLVDGQLHGGIAQGLGQALYEQAIYDENGQLVTGELMDYAVPKATQLPRFETERTETPTPVNPLGAKGVGEAGTIGSTPALVNAVVDALRPLGVKHVDIPVRPERVWRLMQAASAGARS
jgi:carbon-monoxide dehydrogenase large subunit